MVMTGWQGPPAVLMAGAEWTRGFPWLLAYGGRRGGVGGDDGNEDSPAMETVTTTMESTVAGEEETAT